eukprot:jgi/Bigna1/147342/aug1.142_g22050
MASKGPGPDLNSTGKSTANSSEADHSWTSILSVPQDEKGGIITAVEFDESGDTLAMGDKSGHVSLFQKSNNGGYRNAFRFKSHSPALDPLKSLEIEERINMIKFVRGRSSGMYVLTTNGAPPTLTIGIFGKWGGKGPEEGPGRADGCEFKEAVRRGWR